MITLVNYEILKWRFSSLSSACTYPILLIYIRGFYFVFGFTQNLKKKITEDQCTNNKNKESKILKLAIL